MKRLIQGLGKNSAEEYDRIFKERSQNEPNWFDKKRWKKLVKYFDGGMIIDLGCLDSQIWDLIKDKWDTMYYGLDVAEDAIKEMNVKHGWTKAGFIVGDLYDTGVKSNSFDYAVLGEVLEHLEKPEEAVKEAFRILKPEGILAVSVPHEEENEIGAVDGERHVWSFSRKDITDLLKPHCDRIDYEIIGSQHWPKYKYAWPSLVVWGWKK